VRSGIDLDNTIINYERAFANAAAALGLARTGGAGKTELRDRIRLLEAGEEQWMRVQAHVYGPAIDEAVPYDGVEAFFERANACGVPIVIVSHKSEYAAAAPSGTNLRTAARAWKRAVLSMPACRKCTSSRRGKRSANASRAPAARCSSTI
jgi:hypothetical protein